jgi:hypothetical protein
LHVKAPRFDLHRSHTLWRMSLTRTLPTGRRDAFPSGRPTYGPTQWIGGRRGAFPSGLCTSPAMMRGHAPGLKQPHGRCPPVGFEDMASARRRCACAVIGQKMCVCRHLSAQCVVRQFGEGQNSDGAGREIAAALRRAIATDRHQHQCHSYFQMRRDLVLCGSRSSPNNSAESLLWTAWPLLLKCACPQSGHNPTGNQLNCIPW